MGLKKLMYEDKEGNKVFSYLYRSKQKKESNHENISK